jgi:hypothetical protein
LHKGDPFGYDKVDQALDLAQKYGLAAVLETYTHHAKPWGGEAGEWYPHRSHHPTTLPELKWIHERYGKHPALVSVPAAIAGLTALTRRVRRPAAPLRNLKTL